MTESDITEAIISTANQLKGQELSYLSGGNHFTISDVTESLIRGARNEGDMTIPITSVRTLAKALSSGNPIHVDTFFHGKGNYRTALETVVAHCANAGFLPANSPRNSGAKKIVWFPEAIHQIGESFDATEILDTQSISNHNVANLYTVVADFLTATTDTAHLQIKCSLADKVIAALLAKPFLILTGLSGSGKTKLAQAFAKWITPRPTDGEDNPYIALVPVGADWMGNENILGYPNGIRPGEFVSKPALDLILHAGNPEFSKTPHFLILDEMNLSHVERYFADILSAIESEEEIPLYQDGELKSDSREIPKKLPLPKNLFIIGTVNVDETTYMFSPKVLDRANVIEFRVDSTELGTFLTNPSKPNLDTLAGEGMPFAESFVNASRDHTKEVPRGVKESFKEEMTKFFDVLAKESAEFGYRTAYEAGRFLHFYQVLGGHEADDASWFDTAFDAIIIQKFLPKLHGSSGKLSALLNELWKLCQIPENQENPPIVDVKEASGTRFPTSAAKIARMIKLLDRNGFVSFAEA